LVFGISNPMATLFYSWSESMLNALCPIFVLQEYSFEIEAMNVKAVSGSQSEQQIK